MQALELAAKYGVHVPHPDGVDVELLLNQVEVACDVQLAAQSTNDASASAISKARAKSKPPLWETYRFIMQLSNNGKILESCVFNSSTWPSTFTQRRLCDTEDPKHKENGAALNTVMPRLWNGNTWPQWLEDWSILDTGLCQANGFGGSPFDKNSFEGAEVQLKVTAVRQDGKKIKLYNAKPEDGDNNHTVFELLNLPDDEVQMAATVYANGTVSFEM